MFTNIKTMCVFIFLLSSHIMPMQTNISKLLNDTSKKFSSLAIESLENEIRNKQHLLSEIKRAHYKAQLAELTNKVNSVEVLLQKAQLTFALLEIPEKIGLLVGGAAVLYASYGLLRKLFGKSSKKHNDDNDNT